MASILKVIQTVIGLVVTILLVLPLWQRCFAQAPGEGNAPEEGPPEVIHIPSSGYQPQPKTAESEKGRQLFVDLNCMACHSIHSVGGDLAPTLDAVGGRRNESFLLAHLSNSLSAQEDYKRIRGMDFANSLPHSRYTPETARLLVVYLNTLPEPQGGFVVMPHVPRMPADVPPVVDKNFKPLPVTESSIEGKRLYDKFGCVACHAVGEVGGWFGPRLDGVGARHSRDFIVAHVTDAQAHAKTLTATSNQAVSRMPRFTIGKDQVEKITDFLLTLPKL